MRKAFLLIVGISLFSRLISQTNEVDLTRDFQFTFFYPLGTSFTNSVQHQYKFSINWIYGINGGIDGLEFGAVLNSNIGAVNGCQLAGVGNLTADKANGFQGAGIFNITGGPIQGVQAAGIFNICTSDIRGAQLTGVVGMAADSVKFQASGVLSSSENVDGMQMAGVVNNSGNVNGVQMAGIVNKAKYVKGAQIASIFNICDSIKGVPIALVSYVKHNGYRKFEVSGTDLFYANLSYRIGVRKFHTIFSASAFSNREHYDYGFGIGFGSNFMFSKRWSLDLNLLYYNIVRELENSKKEQELDNDAHIITFRTHLMFDLTDKISLFGGPAINFLMAETGETAIGVAPGYTTIYKSGSIYTSNWFGFSAGIRF